MESKRDRELGALERKLTNFLRGNRSIPSSVPQSALLQQLPSGASGKKPEWLSQEFLWDCIWVPLTPPLPTRTNPTPRVSAQTMTRRENGSVVTQPSRPSTTNQRLAARMLIFASEVGGTWPGQNLRRIWQKCGTCGNKLQQM